MNNITKGLSVVLTSLLFASCGGGGGGGTPAPVVEPTPFSTISGTISDGPIENAKVCITDVELDSEYCPTYTDASGKYSFEYIVENGKQYLITAYGDGVTTVDEKDNPGAKLDFVMFQPLQISGSIASTENIGTSYTVDVNPVSFRNAIKNNFSTYTSYPSINNFVSSTSTSATTLFKDFILNKITDTNVTTFINEVKDKVKLVNTTAQNAVIPTQTYVNITDETLKTQLTNGTLESFNNTNLENLINTYIAYKVIDDARSNSSSAYSIFKKITSGTNTIVNFKSGLYEGTVMFDSNGDLIDANYYQDFTDSNGNKLSGYIKIKKDTNGDDILSLRKGKFTIYVNNYTEGVISGNVTVENAQTQFASTSTNDNTIENTDATLAVLALPTPKIIANDFIGIWNGTYSVSSGNCSAGNISITFNSSNGTWTAGNNYGVEAVLNETTNKVTLNNGSTAWSNDGTLNTDKTTISGTWNDGTCTGSFTTTKQTAN